MNRLYFGDNLKWLSDRKEFPDESVDLVYLDPPFNDGSAPQLPETFTDDGVSGDDGPTPRRTVEGLLNGNERIDAPPQLNPFAMAARESPREKQTEML
jgi:hypothetical protein